MAQCGVHVLVLWHVMFLCKCNRYMMWYYVRLVLWFSKLPFVVLFTVFCVLVMNCVVYSTNMSCLMLHCCEWCSNTLMYSNYLYVWFVKLQCCQQNSCAMFIKQECFGLICSFISLSDDSSIFCLC